jgi:hypothetical protein
MYGRLSIPPLVHAFPIIICALSILASSCDAPETYVVLENGFAASSTPWVLYQGLWQAVAFDTPLQPGASSAAQSTAAASDNMAYVIVTPGWSPKDTNPPTSFIVLESRSGFSVHLNQTLDIIVNDATFAGNCTTGSVLSQADADFITQRVFSNTFAGLKYDAATCTTSAAAGDDPMGPSP